MENSCTWPFTNSKVCAATNICSPRIVLNISNEPEYAGGHVLKLSAPADVGEASLCSLRDAYTFNAIVETMPWNACFLCHIIKAVSIWVRLSIAWHRCKAYSSSYPFWNGWHEQNVEGTNVKEQLFSFSHEHQHKDTKTKLLDPFTAASNNIRGVAYNKTGIRAPAFKKHRLSLQSCGLRRTRYMRANRRNNRRIVVYTLCPRGSTTVEQVVQWHVFIHFGSSRPPRCVGYLYATSVKLYAYV